MSYILDALQKAQRERLRDDPQKLDDFVSASWNPYQPTPKPNPAKIAAMVLLLIMLGVGVYWIFLTPVSDAVQSVAVDPELPPAAVQQAVGIEKKLEESGLINAMRSLPVMTVSGHMFIAEGSASNRLFTGQRTLRPGDAIDQHWRLISIGLNGFEVRSSDQTEYLPYR